jgi:RNA polymerase sigma-70 factor, ECF subfamily
MYQQVFFRRQMYASISRCHYIRRGIESPLFMVPNAPTLSDADLMESVRHGDEPAEAALYERYSKRVYYLALKELRSREDSEDAQTETFLRVLQAIRGDRVRSHEALASFILGTAHNVIREIARKRGRTEQFDEQEVEPFETPSIDAAFLDEHVKQTIERVTRRLKPREQAFLRMYYYEELSNVEIARELGIKEERLRLIKSRALKSFKEIYERLTK